MRFWEEVLRHGEDGAGRQTRETQVQVTAPPAVKTWVTDGRSLSLSFPYTEEHTQRPCPELYL